MKRLSGDGVWLGHTGMRLDMARRTPSRLSAGTRAAFKLPLSHPPRYSPARSRQ